MVTRIVGQVRIDLSGEEATVESVGSGGPGTAYREAGTGNREQPRGDTHTIAWPGDELREVVRFDDRGRYRPLSGAKTLPGGWQVRCPSKDVDDVIEAVYPLGTVHMREWERGELRVVSLEDVLARQTGRYAVAASLDDDGRRLAREVLCGDCVRSPVWAGAEPARGTIPCPEPCSVFVSLCREAALWHKDRPETGAINEDVPYAAFERQGNAVREAYIARMA